MILTDVDIRRAVRDHLIEISGFDKKNLGSNSYDLTLGNHLLVYTEPVLDMKLDNPHRIFEIPEDGFVLQPGELYLGTTAETTRTKCYVPCIEGKSSIDRLGISIHLTAGFGDVGFDGHWTLEITAQKPVRIYAGVPICQIYYTQTLGNCEVPYSLKPSAKYSKQPNMPVPSKMFKNF